VGWSVRVAGRWVTTERNDRKAGRERATDADDGAGGWVGGGAVTAAVRGSFKTSTTHASPTGIFGWDGWDVHRGWIFVNDAAVRGQCSPLCSRSHVNPSCVHSTAAHDGGTWADQAAPVEHDARARVCRGSVV